MTKEIKYHTKEGALKAVIQDGYALKFCPSALQNNEEVVMAAIKKDSLSFYHASAELKSNKAFILKALHENVYPTFLVEYANIKIQSDTEALSLAIEKSIDGLVFRFAKEEAALNKELSAKALVKWGTHRGSNNFVLWGVLHCTIQEFFPKDIWYETAQSYLYQLEQEKQAELVTGGSTTEDEVIW